MAQLWRSNDAGAQWTPVGSLTAIAAFGLEAVHVNGQAQPVLITSGLQQDDLQALSFSLNGGKTWQPAPMLVGQLSGQGQVGVRSDGSILAQADGGVFAWKAGESSWHKVAQALAGATIGSLVVSDAASGKETLYLEVRTHEGAVLSFYSINLA